MENLYEIILEGKKYVILNETIVNGTKYVHLVNAEDPEDFCIRKIIIRNNEEILAGLDNEEEFELALKEIVKNESKYLEN